MASWLIVLVGLIYCGVSVDLFLKGNPWLAQVFLGYAFSNIGLYMLSR